MPTQVKIEDVTDPDIDDPKKGPVTSLDFALVKYLDRDDGGILYGAADM